MTNLFFSILLASIFSSCVDTDTQKNANALSLTQQAKTMDLGMDFLDAYKLTIGKAGLFGNYAKFIAEMGIPNKVTIIKADFNITSKADLDKVLANAKDSNNVTLHYQGIDMWYIYDTSVVPTIIDFRKTDKTVTYGKTFFNTTYTIEQFQKEFPKSANPSFALPQSFFEIATKEKGADFKHYMLFRKSKDDPDATPLIEFTFQDGKLIFILFANFS